MYASCQQDGCTEPAEFLVCNPPQTAKLVIGFIAEPVGNATLLTKCHPAHHGEPRVCPDRYSRMMFLPYWLAIRPVSGLLRRQMLCAIRKIAEHQEAWEKKVQA